jgi:transcriptional regulator of arginine metabolism
MRTMHRNTLALDQDLLRLLVQHEIPDQATLLRLLAEEGVHITQGTLSRRLQRLCVQKRDGRYRRVLPADHPLPPYTLVESPPNLLVLQAGPGSGMALAIRVDRSHLPGVAGTIAGEDTLFVAVARDATLEEVRLRLEQALGPPQGSPP